MFVECAAHLGCTAILVVSCNFHNQTHSTRCVSFIGKLLNGCALQLARALLNCSINVVRRHVCRLGLQDAGSQARVELRVSTTIASRNGQLFADDAEEFATLCIDRCLMPLGGCPFAMSGHGLFPLFFVLFALGSLGKNDRVGILLFICDRLLNDGEDILNCPVKNES